MSRLKPVSAPPPGQGGDGATGLRLDTIEGPEAMERFSRLLDAGFGVQEPARFFDDFPIWDERLGPGAESMIRIGVWDGAELVSCAGVRLARLRAAGGDLEVALIGAVATAPSHRGRGFASRTVSLAVEWARERGAAMVLLWGSESGLYDRLGFELCGVQLRVPMDQLELGEPIRDFSRLTLGRGWMPTIAQRLRARESGLRLTKADESWLEAHKRVDWYWLGDPSRPRAYAALGRGIDLQGIVHEWGGETTQELRTLLQLVRMEHPDAQLLANSQLLSRWQLGSAPAVEPEYLCRARALDVSKIAHGFGIRLAPEDPILTTPNAAACRAIFGPSSTAPRDMPLLWIWGLDAV